VPFALVYKPYLLEAKELAYQGLSYRECLNIPFSTQRKSELSHLSSGKLRRAFSFHHPIYAVVASTFWYELYLVPGTWDKLESECRSKCLRLFSFCQSSISILVKKKSQGQICLWIEMKDQPKRMFGIGRLRRKRCNTMSTASEEFRSFTLEGSDGQTVSEEFDRPGPMRTRRQALQVQQQLQGVDHPDVLFSLKGLSKVYMRRGEYLQAMLVEEMIFASRKIPR
jgi:hypothetical protein